MSSDNLDRTLKDLKTTLDNLPPTSTWIVLESWRRRIDSIRNQCNFVGNIPDVCQREINVLERCIRDISAANLIEKGDNVGALKLILQEE